MSHLKRHLFFVLLCIFATSLSAQDISESYLMGKALHHRKMMDSSLVFINRAISEDPNEFLYYQERAEIYFERGNYERALQDLEKVESLKKGYGKYLEAKCYLMLGETDQAMGSLEEHLMSEYRYSQYRIQTDPVMEAMDQKRAWINIWKQEWYTPEEYFENEIEYLIKRKHYTDALEKIKQETGTGFSRDLLYYLRSRTLLAMDNPEAAKKAASGALSLSSVPLRYHVTRARAALEAGDAQLAKSDLSRVLRNEPWRFDLYLLRSRAYHQNRQMEAALRDVDTYLRYFPEDEEALHLAGKIYADNKKYLDALPYLNKLLEHNKEKHEYYAERGNAWLNARSYEYAIADYGMALDLDAFNPEYNLKIGLARYRSGDLEGACADWKRAMRYGSREAVSYIQQHCGH